MQDPKESALFKELYESILQPDGTVMPVGALLQRAAHKFPNSTALIYNNRPISFKQLFHQAIEYGVLLNNKIKKNDRVLIFVENSPFFYVGYFAAAQLGAIVVPLNTFLTEQELAHIVSDSAPSLIITSTALHDRVNAQAGDVPIVTEKEIDLLAPAPDNLPSINIPSHLDSEMAVLLYTSGTTGLPKGVMLSSKNIMTNVIQVIARVQITNQERVFGILPLFHSFAQNICIWSSFFLGCTVILLPKIDRRSIYAGLAQKPTVIVGVPALYGLFCLLKNLDFEEVKYFVSGGDALPDKIRAGFEIIYGRKICNGYGMTEASPVIAAELDDILVPTSTIGKPMVHIDCTIRGYGNKIMEPYAIGEIWVKGDNVMLGYYNAPDATKAIIEDGWLKTGDLGYTDDHGRIIISGRAKDLIAHKGFKIYPQEIENVLMGHPLVVNVGVIGAKQEDVGEIPIAYVQVKEMTDSLKQELRELCQRKLAGYKVPRDFICTDDPLPVTTTNKVDKKVLRKNHS